MNTQDISNARQQLRRHFSRSQFTVWLSWGILFSSILFSLSFQQASVSQWTVFGRSSVRNQTWRNLLSSFLFFTFGFIFFPFSGSHSRWINDSDLWPAFTKIFLILPLFVCSLLSDAGLHVASVNSSVSCVLCSTVQINIMVCDYIKNSTDIILSN